MTLRIKILAKCNEIIAEKIEELETSLKDLTLGAQNDSKSSAGDKHETARAMMQIEQDKISRQLNEAKLLRAALQKISTESTSNRIKNGSLVKTNKGFLFLSIALGKITLDAVNVIVLSPESPLGKKIIGLSKGTIAEINGQEYLIQEIS